LTAIFDFYAILIQFIAI